MANIGSYQKIRQLGAGSSGSVWLCKSKDGSEVAVKLMDSQSMQNENSLIIEMFGNEIEISEKLDHPNIVKLMGHHISDESIFIVMEFVDGGSLEQFGSVNTLLSIPRFLEIITPAAEALEFSSRQGFLHCDLKPSNIFISKEGAIKISDFGAGLRMTNGTVKPEAVVGSPAYMSPEQAQGELMGAASDVYSFGATMYKLTTGRPPFVAQNNYDLMRQTLSAEPQHPSVFRNEIGHRLDSLIFRCLNKRPNERPTWAKIIDELKSIAESIRSENEGSHDRVATFKMLKSHHFFEKVSEQAIWEIASTSNLKTAKSGEKIANVQSKDTDIFLLVSGVAAAFDSFNKPSQIYMDKEVFGDDPYIMKMLGKVSQRHADIKALKDCEYIAIHPESIEVLSVECRLEFMTAYCRAIASRVPVAQSSSISNLSADKREKLKGELVA